MKKYIALYALVAAALAAAPAIVNAQDSTAPKPHAAQAEQHAKKNKRPFHGKVSAVDAAAQTVTVGKTTITVTADTKITKNGAPATFADITVGEKIGGSGTPEGKGKLTAATITIGEKAKTTSKKKKAESND